MGEKLLENLLKKLDKDDVDDRKEEDAGKLDLLQGSVERILNYLLTTVSTTETRIADVQTGIGNVAQYLSTQLSDLTGKLRTLPGLKDLKDPEIPALAKPSSQNYTQFFFQGLARFIEGKAADLLASKGKEAVEAAPEPAAVAGPPADAGGGIASAEELNQMLREKEKELLEKETYLAKLADELSVKEVQLQERESTCEIIEKNFFAATGDNAAQAENGKADEAAEKENELDEITSISESILQGGPLDDDDDELSDDEKMIRSILEGEAGEDDEEID